MDRLPIFLRLHDKACLVVGGGVVAERKVRILLRAGAAVSVLAPTLNDVLEKLHNDGAVTHIAANYRRESLAEYWLVIAATDDDVVNRQVAQAADAAGRLCNVVDDNEASTFILPAIVDRSPVVVAIGTEGSAPVLAQQLKSRIEAILPARIGELAMQAGRWRGLVKKRFDSLRARRRFWQRFFDGPIAEHLLAGRRGAAEKAMRQELVGEGGNQAAAGGEGWIVGAGPGDPGLVTLRAQQLISRADVVVYDRLVSAPILDYARKDAELIYVGKAAGSVTLNQEAINELLVALVASGKRVCRLKGGDPFVFGRGGEEALALADAGLRFQVVPGISAALGCAAYAGIPLTYRGVSGSVTLATARLDKDLSPDWPKLLKSGHTLSLYMGIGALEAVQAELLEQGIRGSLPIALVENGTTPDQRSIYSDVSNMLADATIAGIASPAMLFIGEVVTLSDRLQWFGENTATTSTVRPLPLAANGR